MQTYETHYEITPELADEKGNARLSALLYFAQEAAGEHCELLGLDWDTMAAKELFWAVIRAKVRIHTLPRLGQQVTVKTWPMPTTRTSYPRCVTISDPEGNVLATVVSLWVLMHTRTRAMILPGKSGVEVLGTSFGTELKTPAGLSAGNYENHTGRQVSFFDLDQNLHMNNTRYVDWCFDLFPVSFLREHPLKAITICYNNEALEGQYIDLTWQEGSVLQVDGSIAATDVGGKPTRIFCAQLEF